jgi:hypothetical protein
VLAIDRHDEPAPACLSDERTASAREALRLVFAITSGMVAQTRVSMHGHAFVDAELQASLERLFGGRCAFCERTVPTKPYRFRPTEEAGPTAQAHADDGDRAHLYYTWLTNSWDNIYPLCEGCQPAEASVFPVRGRRCPLPARHDVESYVEQPAGTWRTVPDETSILLDPCGNEDLRRHLLVLPDGRMFGIDERGQFTVSHFRLDRDDVTASRARALASYLDRLSSAEGELPGDLFKFEKLLHGGAWFLLLYQLAHKLGGGAGSRPTLSSKRIDGYYAKRLRRPDFAEDLRAASDELATDFDDLLRKRKGTGADYATTAARPTGFTIRNFKSVEDLEVMLPAPPVVVSKDDQPRASALMILGENATGKSSILEAIALALATDTRRRGLSLDPTRFMLGPSFLGGTGPKRAGEIEVSYEDGYAETIRVATGWPRSREPSLERANYPVFAYGAFRMFLGTVTRSDGAYSVRSLFNPNHVLANPERWLASLHGKPQFSEVVRALRSILAVDQTFDVIEPNPAGEFCLTITHELPDGSVSRIQTPLNAVSSGFRSVLAMACDIMRGMLDAQGLRSPSLARARGMVLIDEVEAHLHPRWKMRIMTGLRQSLPNVSFVVTTHDPLCLRGMATHEVLALRRTRRHGGPAGAMPEVVEPLADLPAIDMLTVEQLLTSDLFNLFSTDASDTENSIALTGDLLALERAKRLSDDDKAKLAELRVKLHAQVRRSIPIGSTRIERLIQDAVELYLEQRRQTATANLGKLQAKTKRSIVAALEQM